MNQQKMKLMNMRINGEAQSETSSSFDESDLDDDSSSSLRQKDDLSS